MNTSKCDKKVSYEKHCHYANNWQPFDRFARLLIKKTRKARNPRKVKIIQPGPNQDTQSDTTKLRVQNLHLLLPESEDK